MNVLCAEDKMALVQCLLVCLVGGGGGGGGEEGGGGLLQCPREVALLSSVTINVQHTFSKTPVYIILSWEMAKQIGWWAMQPLLVACI